MGPDVGSAQTSGDEQGVLTSAGDPLIWGRPTLGTTFDPRHNSLNFLRLIFATLVIVDHADSIGFLRHFPFVGNTTLGTISVYCFFGISGFLIAASATRHRVDRYFWQRFLRIFPAFWVCLAVTAFIFGPLFWIRTSGPLHHPAALGGYFNTPTGPFHYLYHDALLRMNQNFISGTPKFFYWNASLWTLF